MLVDAVAVKAAGQLIVNATLRHLLERHGEGLACRTITAVHGHFQQQVQSARMRKFGLRTEAAITRIKELEY